MKFSDKEKMKIYELLKKEEPQFVGDELFELTEEDKKDGITSVLDKLQLDIISEWNNGYAKFIFGKKEIIVFKDEEGRQNYIDDELNGKDTEELIQLIENHCENLIEILSGKKEKKVNSYFISANTIHNRAIKIAQEILL